MAGLHFDITGDNSNFLRKLDEARNGVRSTSKQIEESGMSIEQMFSRMTKGAAAFGAGITVKEIGSSIVRVRGEFQQLEVAFNTMLGSEQKATSLMQQLVKTAATTPFDLQSVANGAKQLLAYGDNVENVNDDLIRLGNIASGLSQPLNDLVYLYGTTMTQGRLYTQDFNQFTGRGIPMIKELAKQFGVAEGEVKGLVEAGKVGFPEVQKVIQSLTSEGGMFYNLMEKQSKTITGQISNIEDSISTMYNNIGKQSEGFINNSLSGVSYLVENYEQVGKTILELASAYGTYKAAIIVLSAIEKARYTATLAMGAAEKALTTWQAVRFVATEKLTIAQKTLNSAMLKNPYALVGVAVAGLAYGIYKLATAETDAEEAIRTTNESLEAQKKHYDDLKSKSSELSGVLTNESKSIEERFIAYRQLQRLMPSIFKDMDFETAKRLSNTDAIKLETDEILRQQRIGLKTKVVMSEQKTQGLRRSITKTENNGGYAGALKEDLDAAQKELEIYQKALKDFEDAKKESEKSKDEPVVQNKVFWETQKKNAQTELDALTDIEAAGAKGAALKQKIAGYDKKINSFSTNTSKQESAAEKLRKQQDSLRQQQEKYSLLMDKQTLDRQRQQQDLENQAAQAEIDALDDSFEKKDRQRKLNNKKEIQALERQKEDYIRAYIQAEKEKFDAEEELKAKQKKGYIRKTFDPSTVKVDAPAFDGIIGNTSKKQLNDKVREHEDSWNEYLIKFGNYQQKRAAIIEKYDKLIKEAGPAGDVATLEKDKQNAIDELDNSIKNSATLMGQLFADASQKSANEIQNVIEKAELLMQYLESVKDEQGNAQIGGKAVSKKDILGLGVSDNTLKNLELSTKEVEALRNAIEKLKGELGGKSPFKLFETQIDSAIKKINQGGKKNISQGITEIGSAVTSFSPAVSQFGKDLANIVGNDEIGSKISGIADAIGGLGTTAMGVGQIMSGDIVGGAMSVISGISSVVSALDGLFGADYSRYNEMKEQYEALNDIWDELIEKKKEYIDISYGVEASKAGEEAKTIQQKAIESYRTLGLERLNSGASAGSHSIGVRIRKGMSSEGWNQAKNALGDEFYNKSIGDGRMEGLFNLSIEQLKKLKEDAPIFWTKLDGDVQDYLNKIIAGSEEIDEINQKIQEQLTQTSFDNVFDSFMDTLMDMDSSAKDFSDDFGEYMKKAVLMNMLGPEIQEKLKAWYQDFSNDMTEKKDENGNIIEKAGVLTDKELKARKEGWDKIVQEGIAERDALFAAMGWESDTSRKATQKGIATASQESVDENNGRLTMIQGHTYSINESVTSINGNTAKIVENLACMTNISQSMKSILDMKDIELTHLSNISKYTENLVEMKQYMYSMKQGIDTLNTKGLTLKR